MDNIPAYETLADAFAAEGVDTVFLLMGDGNMHWGTAMARKHGARTVHTRHEHCACAAALGYAISTGRIGVASVTCGPGFTQITTALATAAQARIPLVVLAGETPINSRWHNQAIDQAPFAAAAGAHYVSAHSPERMLDHVREAFHVARHERRPAVIGIPYDLQQKTLPSGSPYRSSRLVTPSAQPTRPSPEALQDAVDRIAAARKPIILAGRGVVQSGADAEAVALGERIGALLTTTLLAKGLFDDQAFSLGISGGFGSELSHALFAEADLVIAVGASLSAHTSDGGKLFRNATVLQIDRAPIGLHQGQPGPDMTLQCDAKAGLEAINAELDRRGAGGSGFRSADLARQIATTPADPVEQAVQPGTFHPRSVIEQLDRVVPKDWEIVSGGGHCSYFTTQMRGRRPERFHTIREFGAIGNGLSYAMGVAAAHPHGKVLLVEGDGGFLMHVQELETVRRHGLRILACILNDGAFGSEIHKLRFDGLDPGEAIFGRADLASVAQGFGLRGANIAGLDELPALFAAHRDDDRAGIWNFPISDTVMSPTMRRAHAKH